MTLRLAVTTILLAALLAPRGLAQTPAQDPKAAKPVIPVKVDIVLSRYQGDKKLASMPFALLVNMNDRGAPRTSVRIGVDVPTGGQSSSTSQSGVTTSRPEFRHVGTSIDASGTSSDDGRYHLFVQITDSSIFSTDQEVRTVPRAIDPVAFRSFSASNTLLLRDGQTIQFSVATDRFTGETVRADVTLTVVK